ncbi:MAG: DMT family transporter [Flavobacteriales bacterium]|nr:DMT family transporter [Flavobacteriales bacterium]
MNLLENKLYQWLTLCLLALTWGSSFILMKRGMVSFTDTQVASMRLMFACAVLMPFGIRAIRKVPPKSLLPIALVGLFGNGIPAFLFTKAQTHIDSSMAGIINALSPLFTLIIGILFFGLKGKINHWIGIIIGLAGAILLVYQGGEVGGQAMYAALAILATVFYGFTINLIKSRLHEVPSLSITSIAFLFVGPPATIYLFTTDFTTRLATDPHAMTSMGFVMILGMVGTAFAVVLFNMLIKVTSHLFAASVTYLIPVVAVLWGVLDKEVMSLVKVAAIATILAGIYLVNQKR